MATAFSDVKPFPTSAAAGIGHNRPPLDEEIVANLLEALTSGDVDLMKRAELLAAKAANPADCTDDETAGRYGDFIKMCRATTTAIEDERTRINAPLLAAQRALKGRADAIAAPVEEARKKVLAKVDAYAADCRRQAAIKQAEADRLARIAREEAEAAARAAVEAGQPVDVAPVVNVEAVKIEKPVFQGDLGAKVGSTTIWKHEIQSVRQLPDTILKHAKVVEAIDKVIAAQVKGGTREMKGVKIWSEQTTVVR